MKNEPNMGRISQTLLPGRELAEVLKIPQMLMEKFSGKPTAPILVARACGHSQNSSVWRALNGASVGYGLTAGAIHAQEMCLTPLGERLAAPRSEEERRQALKEAALRPQMMGEFFRKFDCAQMPEEGTVYQFFATCGIPEKKWKSAYKIVLKNAETAGFLREINGRNYLILNLQEKEGIICREETALKLEKEGEKVPLSRVYLSYGRKTSLVMAQLRELLLFFGLQPVDAPERDRSPISLLDKVQEDMPGCSMGIIHLESADGSRQLRPDGSLLVEIGAAIALYGKILFYSIKRVRSCPTI